MTDVKFSKPVPAPGGNNYSLSSQSAEVEGGTLYVTTAVAGGGETTTIAVAQTFVPTPLHEDIVVFEDEEIRALLERKDVAGGRTLLYRLLRDKGVKVED